MTVVAMEAFRRMRGGSQSQLMLATDQRLWVVKFRNNPQGVRILANELIVARLAATLGLSVPKTEIVEVSESLIAENPEMYIQLPRNGRERYRPGQHLGSVFMGGVLPGLVVDYLPEEGLSKVRNLEEFAGILAVDKWTANCDGRQSVFHRTSRQSLYRAAFIDHGFCFNGDAWNFPESPVRGVYARNTVYARVSGWMSFEPWLSRIETIDSGTLSRIAESVPSAWYGEDFSLIERLMKNLLSRRERVRDLIVAFRESYRNPFPLWTAKLCKGIRD